MKMSSFVLPVVIAVMLLCAGCSVKEDRTACPCRLLLDFSDVDPSVVKSADFHISASDGFVFTGTVESTLYNEYVAVEVPRTLVNIVTWCGAGGYATGGVLTIPYGQDCPPVYMHTSNIVASGESVREIVHMRKNHCSMLINVVGEEYEVADLILHGNVNGYGSDGRPSVGEFTYRSEPDESGEARAVVPRQVDDTLVLEVDDGTGISKRFAIGEYIASSGYDWTMPDLQDIIIDIDFAITHISLTIAGWDKEYKYEIVI